MANGRFTTNTVTTASRLLFTGGPSLCFPPKACPGIDPDTTTVPVPYLTHAFTNTTRNELCLTAQLKFGCSATPANAFGVAAYLSRIDFADPCPNYLGDSGLDGSAPFSFRVPAGSNFVMLVSARTTNLICDNYALEIFGLPCPPPGLLITRDRAPGKALVRWSTAYPGYRLQSGDTLDGPRPLAFSNVVTAPLVIDGKYTISNSTTAPRQFFRLAQ